MKQSVETFSGPRLANFTLFFSAWMKIQDLQGLNNKSHISGFFSASMGLRVRHGTDGETDRQTDGQTDGRRPSMLNASPYEDVRQHNKYRMLIIMMITT